MQTGKSDLLYITKYTVPDKTKAGIWYDGDTFKGDNGDGEAHYDYASYNYEDDPARKILGGTWRTPTRSEFRELELATKYSFVDDYNDTGVSGLLLTSKTDPSKSIFLPAAKYWEAALGEGYGYWTSSIPYYTWTAVAFSFDPYAIDEEREIMLGDEFYRCEIFPVRPICD